jgi:hypothetical protein
LIRNTSNFYLLFGSHQMNELDLPQGIETAALRALKTKNWELRENEGNNLQVNGNAEKGQDSEEQNNASEYKRGVNQRTWWAFSGIVHWVLLVKMFLDVSDKKLVMRKKCKKIFIFRFLLNFRTTKSGCRINFSKNSIIILKSTNRGKVWRKFSSKIAFLGTLF